ncbi:MAG TPA: alpha/beta hydrolase [Planktothrix sp.]|jgi:pimeloyl-ACP methyl ester carboxylesterase
MGNTAIADSVVVNFKRVDVGGVLVFYREAGDPAKPTLLLLHGYPTSSHMFRNLIPLLADQYHVIAPDLPGFGYTEVRSGYKYTFDNLAETMAGFVDAIGLKRYALYIFDYGAPVGLRLAMKYPERVIAIISQNGNAYNEGLSEGWKPIQQYWGEPTKANRDGIRFLLLPKTTKWQYVHGTVDETMVAPESYTLDDALMSKPGQDDIQLDLFLDYQNNVKLYPTIHEYFAKHQPPLLAVWGKNDPFFLPAGADAYRQHLPKSEVHFYDTGHFALETHVREIAKQMREFLQKNLS